MRKGKLRLAWAVSGQGRALQAVIDAAQSGLIAAEVVFIVSDRPSPIEIVARQHGIPYRLIEPQEGRYHPALIESVAPHDPEWMGLTFNRLLADSVIAHFGGRIFNLHLSLLPLFPGFGAVAISRMIASGMRMTGATVNLIDDSTDLGPILAQATCPVSSADTRATLGRRLFEISLPMLLQLVRAIAERELTYSAESGIVWPATAAAVANSNVFPCVDADISAFSRQFCAKLDEI